MTTTPPSPSPSLTPTSPLHILPHILLPLLLVLGYFPPPFRFRAPLFLVLLAICQWGCTASPWPPNEGTTRALRYGLSSSWIFVLPTVERIVMHTPERDFFRVEDDDDDESVKKRKREGVKEWSFAKLWRGVRLVCTPRGVGWNIGGRMQFEVAEAVGVGLGVNGVEEWPPLFGSVFDCYTTVGVWGRFWHQYIRQPCLGFSRYFVELLHVPRRSSLAYLIHLTNAFLTSTFFHVLSVGAVAGGYYPLQSLIADMSIFFMIQTVGAAVEGTRRERVAQVVMPAIYRILGHIWVICWFFVTSFWFVRAYAGVRMQDWRLPYSVLGGLLGVPNE
ncbi:membrane bound O-acyl transferase family-domain-containing protein [Podospora aff. communis PSN243]|uniref:Membrane bound O-acyl transferase family-domain-containing protein n=1 Tax=Podospora aff. communis PSN243 TaxID=3040156 RepID=A0AAV9G828_9PEZI|nr:membrane bound O-acyl transferase family-domain-containing protein [Podospora aff. communis PSN243]